MVFGVVMVVVGVWRLGGLPPTELEFNYWHDLGTIVSFGIAGVVLLDRRSDLPFGWGFRRSLVPVRFISIIAACSSASIVSGQSVKLGRPLKRPSKDAHQASSPASLSTPANSIRAEGRRARRPVVVVVRLYRRCDDVQGSHHCLLPVVDHSAGGPSGRLVHGVNMGGRPSGIPILQAVWADA